MKWRHLPILLAAVFLAALVQEDQEGFFSKIVHGSLFPQSLTQFSWSERKIYEGVMLYFGMKFLWLKPGAKLDHLDVYKTKCL